MNITELSLRLLLLFLPGIISKLMIDALTTPHEKRHLYFALHSLILGFLAYFLYAGALFSVNAIPGLSFDIKVRFLDALLDPKKAISISEVYWASGVAILNGFWISLMINRRYFFRLARALRVTKTFADVDVWAYVHNSDDDAVRWARVRDHRHNLCYEGWVEFFSDNVKDNELFLQEVKVFANDTGEELYEVPGLYLAQDPTEITIEFYALSSPDVSDQQEGARDEQSD